MKHLAVIIAIVAGFGIVAGCSASTDVDPAATGTARSVSSSGRTAPHWITAGIELARGSGSSSGDVADDTSGSTDAASGDTTPGSTAAEPAGLPPREQVIPVLTAAGLNQTQATCVYNGVAANPQVSSDIAVLLRTLSAAQGASGATSASSAIASLSTLSPETGTRLTVAIAPCLDSATLFGLLSASGGGGGSLDLTSLAALVGKSGVTLPVLPTSQAAQISALVGALSPAQTKQLQQLLEGAKTLSSGNLAGLDLAHLDLSKLTPDQMSLLVAALLHGLSPAQEQQLTSLATVDLDKLKLSIDPKNLKPEEIGQLLLLISPLLAASISPTGFKPPAGVDPTQIYIPPGTDLSQLNPLLFLNKDDLLRSVQQQGGSPEIVGCLYDKLRTLSPATLAKFFSSANDSLSTATVTLAAITCVTNPKG